MTILPKRVQITILEGGIWLRIKIGQGKNLLFVTAKVDPMNGKAQMGCHNESRVGEARVRQGGLRRQTNTVVDQFVIWEGEICEWHKQSMKQNTKTKNMNLTSNKTQPWWIQTQQSNWNKNLWL
jgi:hypothetical protein